MHLPRRQRAVRCAVSAAAGLALMAPAALSSPASARALLPGVALPNASTGSGVVGTFDAADRLAALLPERMASPRLGSASGAVLSIDVIDGRTGRTLFSKGASSPARPASTAKIITAAVALATMGASHRVSTPVRLVSLSGPSGSRTATVALVGTGDALMTSAELDRLASDTVSRLRTRGANRVVVRIDDTLFPSPTPAVGWPSTYGLDVVRPVRPLVRDSMMLADVAADAGRYFAGRVAARGASGGTRVSADYAGRLRTTPASPVIARTYGHTVQEIVKRMLRVSENQDAEMLFRLSALASGRSATWENGRTTALQVLSRLGVPTSGVTLRDGSGASREARVPPRTLTVLLQRAISTSHPELWPIYHGGALPTAGRTGTLSSRYLTAPSKCAAGVTLAKTGALRDVLSLSGVTVASDGVPRVFAIMLQNPPTAAYGGRSVRVAIDGLVATVNGCW